MHLTRFRLLLTLLLLVGSAAPVAAQTVVGRVLDQATMEPLAGAFVVLEDTAGVRHEGVLAGPEGRFVLRAGAPGRYRLVAELIGYASTRSPALNVPAGGTIQHDIRVPVQAVSLDGIEVQGESRCRRRPGTGAATARLWEEARKALDLARWSEAQGVLQFEVVEHRRELDARSLRVAAQEQRVRSGLYDQSPYQSVPAARLDRGGYVQRGPDGIFDWYAPDAAVLLSDSFLDTHCFRVAAPSREESGLVGLAFEPVPERDLPDIEGVLWIDRATGELRRLDFRYVQIPMPHGDWPQVGGRIEFERLSTGMWIVRRWRIRMPLEAKRSGGYGNSSSDLELLTVSEQGAEVRSVRTRDGTTVAEATGATLYGTATRAGGEPLGDATVAVVPADKSTRSGPDGAFRITGLPSGRYTVRLTHPDLDLLGLSEEVPVELEPGRATRLPLKTSLTPERARALCARSEWTAGTDASPVLVYGRVTGPDGADAVPGALIEIEAPHGTRRVTADSLGAFRFCTAASAAPIVLSASVVERGGLGASAGEGVEAPVARPGFHRVDLRLSRSAVAGRSGGSARGSAWSNALLGEVIDASTGDPVVSAMVSLVDRAGEVRGSAVTNDQGQFRIPHPDRGSRYTLEVEHVGYGPSTGDVRFAAGEELRIEVKLAVRAIELEPIIVEERRRGLLVDAGFYDRLERGRGLFVDREEIERRRPSRLTDLLRGRPGLDVVSTGPLEEDVRLMQTVTLLGGMEDCQPKVIVDDAVVRAGGPRKREVSSAVTRMESLNELVAVDQVEAMEVYRHASSIPIRFGGADAACGVIVVWTRRP